MLCSFCTVRRIFPLFAFAAFALFSSFTPLQAANFTVSSTGDSPSDPTTLRAAINGVQNSPDVSDTITITATGTILLTNGELALTNPNAINGKTVTIAGPGAGALFVSGGRAPASTTANGTRVFHFAGVAAGMSNLAVIQGFVNSGSQGGAGILIEGGSLTLDHCVVEDCFTNLSTSFGGGIANVGGALTMTNCVVTSNGNSPFSGVGGDGIGSQSGSLTMTDCVVDYNSGSGLGGGIGSAGETLTLTRCKILSNSTLNTNRADADGGGIYSQNDTTTLTDCTISNNSASTAGDGVYFKYGTLTMRGCTVSGNATGGGLISQGFVFNGGGLYLQGATVSIANCTITGNAADVGGGIYNLATLMLTDSTIYNNSGGNASSTRGAGLFTASGATAAVTSTILAANRTFNGESDVVSPGSTTSGGSNLLGDANGSGFTNGVNHDQTGVMNFRLNALADNGGPTPTLSLPAGSPAIDADFSDTTSTDQRGAMRPFGVRNDIGAFESGASAASNSPDVFTVTNADADGDGSLRRAVNNADADFGATIVFDPSVFSTPRTVTLVGGPLALRQTMTIVGPGRDLLTVSGNNALRVLDVEGGAHAVSGLTVANGNAGGASGGGISGSGGLTLTDAAITNCTASGGGGGLDVGGGATLTRCTVTGNSAPGGFGGGIDNAGGNLTLTDCTVAGNSAASGGGIATSGGFASFNTSTISGNSATAGGGIYTSGGFAFLSDCTVSGNTATTGGGMDCASSSLIFMTASTVAANAASTGSGLSVESGGSAYVGETILAGNTNGANVAGTVTSQGSNLIGDANGNGFTNGVNSDQTGVANPRLGPLQNNGGPTPTMALLAGSPAIDADYAGDGGTDQRGAARPVGARNDIGAYEYGFPVAQNDAYAVSANIPLTVAAPGVLANDVSDGATLTASVVTQPTHGTLTLRGDGSFTYTPDVNFLGTDAFTYQARDASGRGGTATVTLTVQNAAQDVSSQVQVKRGGFRFNRGDGTFVQEVTLTNRSGASVSGPISLVLDNATGTLVNRTGVTAATSPSGSSYLSAPDTLAPGASTLLILRFTLSGSGVTYTTRVLAGTGAR